MKGHTKEGCYKLIGYPTGFKGKRKMNINTAYNVCAENANPNIGTGNAGNTGQLDGYNKGEMARTPQLTAKQYDQIMKMLSLNANHEKAQENMANMAGNITYSFLLDVAKAY